MAEPEEVEDERKKVRAWPLLRRFLPWMRPHLRYVWVAVGLQLLATPLALAAPLVIQRVVDDAVSAGDADDVLFWGGLLVSMSLLSVGFGIAVGYATTLFHTKVIRDLRVRLYRHMQTLGRRWYSERETGQLMSRQTDDVDNLGGVMADSFARVAVEALRGLGYLVMLFLVEWRMATGGLILVAGVFGFAFAISGALRRRNKEALQRWTEVSGALHQGLSGIALVQANASEVREALRFLRRLHASVRAGLRRDLFSLWTNHVYGLISGIGPSVIILGGVWLIVSGEFTVGGLFAFFMYLVQMFGAVATVAGFNSSLQRSAASLERIFEVLDTRPEIESPPDGGRRIEVRGELRFEGVGFSYDEARPVLRGIDLEIRPDSLVALVGPSGAGKSTLAQLVPRFLDPSEGRVLVDGVDLRELDLRHYRKQIGLVPQEVFLFDRTVAENIAYGRPEADPEEIRAAAAAANALDFVEAMPEGFETMIGERGFKLSGGQRQRLAIAREVLRNPRILILDEATSSLDTESERLIQEALGRLLRGRTSLVIAHRLSTVVGADLICVLDDGRIVERGRHPELLALGGLYARLYESRFDDDGKERTR